jgi:hypothetical protein
MFLFRRIFLVLGLLALCSAPQAATVLGVGGSFSDYSGEPGIHLMTGFQGDLITISPKHFEVEGRALFSKLNFGAKNMDNLSIGAIGYTQTQLWELRLGIHGDIDYEVADYENKDINWTVGVELYKPTLLKDLPVFGGFEIPAVDMFISGDLIFRGKDAPQTLGVVVVGLVLNM